MRTPGINQISRVGSILWVGNVRPHGEDPALKLPSCWGLVLTDEGPQAPLGVPTDRGSDSLSACPRFRSEAAQPGRQLSSHSSTEPACSPNLHWAVGRQPAVQPHLDLLEPELGTAGSWISVVFLCFSPGRPQGTWGIGAGS